MTPTRKSLRLGRFRSVARDILMSDREARRLRTAVDTGGSIVRALERAYQEGFKDAEAGPKLPAAKPRALQWAEIPRRAADLLETALPRSEYDRATGTATLDLARETGLFLAVETGPDTRYRVVMAGPRWKGQVYMQEQTYSPRFFQILLRMGLVTAGTLPDGQGTLLPTSMALSAFRRNRAAGEKGRLPLQADSAVLAACGGCRSWPVLAETWLTAFRAATQPSAGSARKPPPFSVHLAVTGTEPPLVSRLGRAHLQSMARKNIANPFAAYAWFAEAGWVFAMHSAQLWADPARASARLAALGVEKQKAFAEGTMKASTAAMRGASLDAVARTAMAPARRRVRANARRIQKG